MPDIKPTVTGQLSAFTVEQPGLPTGLTIDPNSGEIKSANELQTTSPATDYTISAKTAAGVVKTCIINIAIIDPSLPKITYSPSSNVFTQNVAVLTLNPTVTGGNVTGGYLITPDLHAATGLNFDPVTGSISGNPSILLQKTNFVVTGKTDLGDRFTNLAITVVPYNLYSPATIYAIVDTPVSLKPVSPIANSFYTVVDGLPENSSKYRKEVRNAKNLLPDGLSLNSATGEIRGTPTRACPQTEYTIMATDRITMTQTCYIVNITVDPQPDIVKSPSSTISFVGQGDIQQSLNSGSAIAANTGIGVIYRQNSSRRYGILHNIEIDFSINVASTVDTIKPKYQSGNFTNRADYGTSVLIPSNSGQAFSFNFKGYFTQQGGRNGNFRRNAAPWSLGGVLSGFDIAFNGSNNNWEYQDSNGGNETSFKTSLLSFYAGPFFEFVTPTKDNGYGQNASITLGIGYSGRWILGDAQSALTSQILDSSQNSFNGAEIKLALRFYNIKAEVHLPFLSTTKTPIAGLTGTHLTTFIGFSGGFPIDLTKSSNQ